MANPTGPLELQVRVSNTNARNVIAKTTLKRAVSGEWELSPTISTGNHYITFENLPHGLYEAEVQFLPIPADEGTINPSAVVPIFTNINSKPISVLGHDVLGSDIGGKTLYGIFNVGESEDGVHTRDVQANLTYGNFTSSENFPITYLTQEQHRFSYKLIAGAGCLNMSETVLGVGQDEAKILIQPMYGTGSLDFRGCRIRLEPDIPASPGVYQGTFQLRIELEVYNPIKQEWSIYDDRVFQDISCTFTFEHIST